MSKLNYKITRNKGFTLVELLIVMTIIGILSGLSIFSMDNARKTGRDGQRKTDLETVRQAMEMYRADCGVYPTSISFGSSLSGSAATCNPAGTVYIQKLPQDPTGSVEYQYVPNGTFTAYVLCAKMENPTGLTPAGCSGGRDYGVTNP